MDVTKKQNERYNRCIDSSKTRRGNQGNGNNHKKGHWEENQKVEISFERTVSHRITLTGYHMRNQLCEGNDENTLWMDLKAEAKHII